MFNRAVLTDLCSWVAEPSRKPLLLRGARQVGKTSIVRELGRRSFTHFCELNLEQREIARHFKEPMGLDDFLLTMKVNFSIDLAQPGTLLFIDEIQEVPWFIELFRFFYEKLPALAVIGSGSLLEVKLSQLKLSMPVGRVDNRYMYPLDYFEFLEAIGEVELLEYLRQITLSSKIPEPIHQKAISLYHRYIILGGMPEVIKEYRQGLDDKKLASIKSSLLSTYLDDISKYSSDKREEHLQFVLENAPNFAGTRFNYAKFANSKFRSDQMKIAFGLLSDAMLLWEVEATDRAEIPLMGQSKRQRKLIYLDVGLVSHRFGLGLHSPQFAELADLFRGQIGEQVAGQQLAKFFELDRPRLFYWSKQSNHGDAEVDFILSHRSKLLAIEVKSGVSGRLRSLLSLADSNPELILFRAYSGQLKVESIAGKTIHSLPFYLLGKVLELVE